MTDRVILCQDPAGRLVAVGPFRSKRAFSAACEQLAGMPGWEPGDPLPLISGADLKYMPLKDGNDEIR